MLVTNKTYASIQELDQDLDLSQCRPSSTLVQVFSGIFDAAELEKLHAILVRKCATISFIGTTTAGEINGPQFHKETVVISIIEFEHVQVRSYYSKHENARQIGIDMANALVSKTTQATIMFVDGLFTNGSDVLDGFSSIASHIPIAGGLAGDNGFLKQTFVFDNRGVYKLGAVGVSLNGSGLRVASDYSLGWQPVGRTMTVTKVDKNRLYELDNMSVFEVYKKYMGEDISSRLPHSAVEFPLIKTEANGIQVCRTFNRLFDDGSVLIIGNLSLGDKVHFSFGNIDLILADSSDNNKLQAFQAQAILVYSCIVRFSVLQSQVARELNPLAAVAPTAGFFTYGEFFHHEQSNHLLNATLTTLALSELPIDSSPKQMVTAPCDKHNEKNLNADKRFIVLKALTNLNNTIIAELNDANHSLLETQKQLRNLANQDHLTSLCNRRYFFELAQAIISSSQRKKHEFSLIMIDIDKFKAINDSYGHDVGDKTLVSLALLLQKQARASDIVARVGGEEFVVFLPFTGLNEAEEVAERLRECVEQNTVHIDDNRWLQITISLGLTSLASNQGEDLEQALKLADIALYQAKNQGRNRVMVHR